MVVGWLALGLLGGVVSRVVRTVVRMKGVGVCGVRVLELHEQCVG